MNHSSAGLKLKDYKAEILCEMLNNKNKDGK